jgi:single-strand DNA-binding protein
MNVVIVQGALARAPELRELQSGSLLVLLEVSTDHPSGRATVPVAWLDPPGEVDLEPGTEIVVTGHVRRRFFRAGGSTQRRTEVVADHVVKARARARARRAVDEALAVVGARSGA